MECIVDHVTLPGTSLKVAQSCSKRQYMCGNLVRRVLCVNVTYGCLLETQWSGLQPTISKVLILPFSLHVGAKPWYVKSHQERMNIQATSERLLSMILFCS